MSATFPYLTEVDIRHVLPMPAAIEAMRDAFAALGEGRVSMPVRLPVNTPHGVSLFMPASIAGRDGQPGQFGQKTVSVFAGNRERGLPVIHALVTLIDDVTGVPVALLDGTYLTALRTGAVSGLATDLLAKPDAAVMTMVGAGGQARTQIEAVCAVRPITRVNIVSRGNSAFALAAQLALADPSRQYVAMNGMLPEAIGMADVIATATQSTEPLFGAAWVKPGAHINAVGAYRHDMREIGADLLRTADVYVDDRSAALAEAGDLLVPHERGEWSLSDVRGALADLVLSQVVVNRGKTTVFKSCGLAIEDVAAAAAALAAWRQR
jgi:alanine dehydrogenase